MQSIENEYQSDGVGGNNRTGTAIEIPHPQIIRKFELLGLAYERREEAARSLCKLADLFPCVIVHEDGLIETVI